MADKQKAEVIVTAVLSGKENITKLIENLDNSSRRVRQMSASAIEYIAREEPEMVIPFWDDLFDALDRSEAQTRWEILDTFTTLIPFYGEKSEKILLDAENALFDEDSGPLRLAGMCFICTLGATDKERSVKVWPLIDEAIQCYHGDIEFGDMLLAVTTFAEGDIAEEVKEELADRMMFDAKNGKGALKCRAEIIVEALK